MKLVKTYKEMIESYYQPFNFEIGENAPKLTKQLTKQGKDFTVEVEYAEEGADDCLYCCDCIHDHLEDEDEE